MLADGMLKAASTIISNTERKNLNWYIFSPLFVKLDLRTLRYTCV
jgi:hypothetical protein